jgi:O-antigen/teichoic acid export membrane protein
MASTTILFGVLLTLLGFLGYFMTGTSSLTALIPAAFGVLLIALGFIARSEATRKHAMHAAAAVSLIGMIGALIPLLRTPAGVRPAMAVASQVAMVVLTALFLALCVRSFIAARRARRLPQP